MLGLNNFIEPCLLVYDVPTPSLDEVLSHLRRSLKPDAKEDLLVLRCREKRFERTRIINEAIENSVSQRSELFLDASKGLNRLP